MRKMTELLELSAVGPIDVGGIPETYADDSELVYEGAEAKEVFDQVTRTVTYNFARDIRQIVRQLEVSGPPPNRLDLVKEQLDATFAIAERRGEIDKVIQVIQACIQKVWLPHSVDEINLTLSTARCIEESGDVDGAISHIFEQFDALLRAGRFELVNEALAAIQVDRFSIDLLMSLLTITLAAKKKLPRRSSFFCDVKKHIILLGEFEENLLVGLD
jgi:hypothetical protein